MLSILFLILLGASAQNEARIAVLNGLREDFAVTSAALHQTLVVDYPELTISSVRAIMREIKFYSLVPARFHQAIESYVARGGTNPEDPELVNTIQSMVSRSTDPKDVARAINIWMTYCIYPSINFPGTCCSPVSSNPNLWVLSMRQVGGLIDGLIYEAFGITTSIQDHQESEETIRRVQEAFKSNISLDPQLVSEIYQITPRKAKEIRRNIFEVFSQPSWLLDILITTQHGPISSDNPTLLRAIQEEEERRGSRIRGDINQVIGIWKTLVIDRINNGDVNPLPYIRTDHTVNGNTVELVVIRASLVQKYLS